MEPCPGSDPGRSREMHPLCKNTHRNAHRHADVHMSSAMRTYYHYLEFELLVSLNSLNRTCTACISAQVYTEEKSFTVQSEIII